MTRQPAEENRFTVAWPMPRDAPVSSMIRFAAVRDASVAIVAFDWMEMGAPSVRPTRMGQATQTWQQDDATSRIQSLP